MEEICGIWRGDEDGASGRCRPNQKQIGYVAVVVWHQRNIRCSIWIWICVHIVRRVDQYWRKPRGKISSSWITEERVFWTLCFDQNGGLRSSSKMVLKLSAFPEQYFETSTAQLTTARNSLELSQLGEVWPRKLFVLTFNHFFLCKHNLQKKPERKRIRFQIHLGVRSSYVSRVQLNDQLMMIPRRDYKVDVVLSWLLLKEGCGNSVNITGNICWWIFLTEFAPL